MAKLISFQKDKKEALMLKPYARHAWNEAVAETKRFVDTLRSKSCTKVKRRKKRKRKKKR